MPPALIAAGVGAAASIGGGLLSANAQKKAANKAADTSLQTAQMNNALAEKIYNHNQANLNPYNARGNAAGDMINALLGLNTAQAAAPTIAQSPTSFAGSPLGTVSARMPVQSREPSFYPVTNDVDRIGRIYSMTGDPIGRPQQMAAPMAAPQTVAPAGLNPEAAFNNYLNSTGYQFRVNEGNKAINQGYAAGGMLESGAALKALQDRGQNIATDYFKDYIGMLANQQGVGLSGASAVAGVGQNYVNTVSANNNSAGTAAANAALAKGAINSNLYAGIGNSLGNLAGSMFGGSSYRGF